jgi:hypothetical protein
MVALYYEARAFAATEFTPLTYTKRQWKPWPLLVTGNGQGMQLLAALLVSGYPAVMRFCGG